MRRLKGSIGKTVSELERGRSVVGPTAGGRRRLDALCRRPLVEIADGRDRVVETPGQADRGRVAGGRHVHRAGHLADRSTPSETAVQRHGSRGPRRTARTGRSGALRRRGPGHRAVSARRGDRHVRHRSRVRPVRAHAGLTGGEPPADPAPAVGRPRHPGGQRVGAPRRGRARSPRGGATVRRRRRRGCAVLLGGRSPRRHRRGGPGRDDVVEAGPGTIQAQLPYPIEPSYLLLQRQTPAQPGRLPAPSPLPELSEGPHLSYAIQWFTFAAIAVAGCVVLALRDGREPRTADDRAMG